MELKELITKIIKNINLGKMDDRINSYMDYKTKYVVLKPSVKVTVELTNGKIATIDVSDYFKEVIK